MKQFRNIPVRRAGSFAVLLAMAVLIGCDDSDQATGPTTKPAVVTVTTRPADLLAETAVYHPTRPPSTLLLDGREVSFPAARLMVIGRGTGGVTLRLCSDDPPNAIDPGYVGNSYNLDMRIAIDHMTELPAAMWDFKSGGGDDASNGIYLHGYRQQLHPGDVHATFTRNDNEMIVCITGTFLQTEASRPGAIPQRVQVVGYLHTNLPAE